MLWILTLSLSNSSIVMLWILTLPLSNSSIVMLWILTLPLPNSNIVMLWILTLPFSNSSIVMLWILTLPLSNSSWHLLRQSGELANCTNVFSASVLTLESVVSYNCLHSTSNCASSCNVQYEEFSVDSLVDNCILIRENIFIRLISLYFTVTSWVLAVHVVKLGPGPDISTLTVSAQLVTVKYEHLSTLSNLWRLLRVEPLNSCSTLLKNLAQKWLANVCFGCYYVNLCSTLMWCWCNILLRRRAQWTLWLKYLHGGYRGQLPFICQHQWESNPGRLHGTHDAFTNLWL